MNSYELSRIWFDWCFENPTLIKPNHTALYFFCIEHCNRLGWKKHFGLPTTMTKEAIGIRSYNTFITTLNDLVTFGFLELIEKSKNQYSSNIIALSKKAKANNKALDKAFIKHDTKQSESTGESIDSIDKPITINKEPNNNEQGIKSNSKYLEIINSKIWTESIAMQKKIPWVQVIVFLDEFLNDLWLKQDFVKPIPEIKKHFISWLNIKIEKNGTTKQNTGIKKVTPGGFGQL